MKTTSPLLLTILIALPVQAGIRKAKNIGSLGPHRPLGSTSLVRPYYGTTTHLVPSSTLGATRRTNRNYRFVSAPTYRPAYLITPSRRTSCPSSTGTRTRLIYLADGSTRYIIIP